VHQSGELDVYRPRESWTCDRQLLQNQELLAHVFIGFTALLMGKKASFLAFLAPVAANFAGSWL
jgi:hypothetical protein